MSPHKYIEGPLIGTILNAPEGPEFICTRGRGHGSRITIEALPDDTLLDIFYFRLQAFEDDSDRQARSSCWITLVHICQRWRNVVFAFPLRLNLCLSYTDRRTRVRETLNVWPPLPIEILSNYLDDNVLAALEHRDRVRGVSLLLQKRSLERLVTLMQESFPALESLTLAANYKIDEPWPVLPSTFLGGSAPRLQRLSLWHISLPTLPQLLSSSEDLVDLSLESIPYGDHISPEAMATCICALTRLTNLRIIFSPNCRAPRSHPGQRTRRLSPLTRIVLASLTKFQFYGDSKFSECLVARIEAPVLKVVTMTHNCLTSPNQHSFDIQNLAHFIDHSPILMSYNRAKIIFGYYDMEIMILPTTKPDCDGFSVAIKYNSYNRQYAPVIAQICSHFSTLLSGVEWLKITLVPSDSDMDDAKWLELLRRFISVQTLELCYGAQICVVSALKGFSMESATEILPALGHLYLEERPRRSGWGREDIGRFIAARQCSNHPVALHFLKRVVKEK